MDEPDRLRAALDRHDLMPSLHSLAKGSAEPGTLEPLLAYAREQYFRRVAERMLAVGQLEEIAAAFQEDRIDLIALKGASAFLWLYEAAECRPVLDLDLLVRPEAVPQVRRVMRELGYATLPNRSSEAEEDLLLSRTHMRPYLRPGRLPVEFHTNILQGRGDPRAAAAELWTDAVEVRCGSSLLRRLSAPHFILHGCVHYMKDLESGSASLKGLVDLLRVLHRHGQELDSRRFWELAARWGVGSETAVVMGTLREPWGAAIPGGPTATPVPDAALVDGWADAGERQAARQFGAYVGILGAMRELPGFAARLRFISGLVFPAPEKLRLYYGLGPQDPLLRYYLRHPLRVAGRLLRSLLAAARGRRSPSESRRH